MKIRSSNHRAKTLGAAAALTAIAVAIPTSIQAYADPASPTTEPSTPTTSSSPATKVPDPQGSGCDDYNKRVPTGAGSFAGMATQSASEAIASNPDLSTFSAAISGKLNPLVNIVGPLDGGPYIVFAPTDDAFAKLDQAQFDALKADPARLTSVLYYHMVLGFLNPDDVHGKMPTQDGALIDVTGKGGDIKVNNVAKVVCGGITARGSAIYMIDTVLDPAQAPEANATSSTTPTTATTTPTSSETPTSAETPTSSENPTATSSAVTPTTTSTSGPRS